MLELFPRAQCCLVDGADWLARLFAEGAAGFKLRGDLEGLAGQGADFHRDGPVGRLHRLEGALEFQPVHAIHADAEGSGLAENQLRYAADGFLFAQGGELEAWAIFLHLDGG